MRTFTLLLFATVLSASGASAAESVFTKLKLDACKTLLEDQGGVVLGCAGLKGYPVLYKEGDLRPSLFYGPLSKQYKDEAFESFSAFASVNETVEWRLEGQIPAATILRYFIANADPETGAPNEKLKGQVLVVSKVASKKDPRGCVIGLVDALANKKANDLARQVADEKASTFQCGTDTPGFVGQRGPLSSEFSSNVAGLAAPQ